MNNFGKQKEAAWYFMQWASSVEHDLFGARKMDFVNPVRDSVWKDEAFRARILEFPPERVAAICGLPAETVVDLGKRIAHTRPTGIRLAMGAGRADVMRMILVQGMRLVALGAAIGGLGTTCEYQSPDPAILRKNVEETKEWVKLAHDIGSPSVKVRPNGIPKDVSEERTLQQIGKALAECGAFAHGHGVKIQLEVHRETTSRLPRIRKILDYGGNHPDVRICWNSNQTDLLDGGFDANFRLVRDEIGQLHMRDLFLEEYPWRRLLAALSDMKFDGYCFAEIPESADPLRVLQYFRGLFRAYQNL